MSDDTKMTESDVIGFYNDVTLKFVDEVLGHPEILVSEVSGVFDFAPHTCGGPEYRLFLEGVIARTKKVFGVDITSVVEELFQVLIPFLVKGEENENV